MKNQNRERVTGTLKVICLGVVLLVGIGLQTGGLVPVSYAAPVNVQASDGKVVKEKQVRVDVERELKRQNRQYKKQAASMERQYRRRAQSAESSAESDAMMAIAEYWRVESARAR